MSYLITGILIFISCCLIFLLSFHQYNKLKISNAILLLILAGLILRVFTSCDFYLHLWDERFHALVAKNMIGHPFTPTLYDNPLLPFDYKQWYANNVWLHKQPLPLWIMAASMKIFGVNELALRLPGILFSTLGIYLTFKLGKYFFNEKTGFVAAFFFSINGLIIEITAGRIATDHYDSYFLFFIELAIVFSINFSINKNWINNILAGLFVGFAILTKWLPGLIVLPIWIIVIKDSGKFNFREGAAHFAILLLVCATVFLPWQIYIYHFWPKEAEWEREFNNLHITEVLDNQGGPWFYFIEKLRINYGELIYIPLIWLTYHVIKYRRVNKKIALLIWIFVPILFFSIVKTKMQGYILFTAPALFIVSAEFISKLSELNDGGWRRRGRLILIGLMVLLPLRYTIERTKIFNKVDRSPVWVTGLKELNERKITRGVLFNYGKPIEAMFYTDFVVYPSLPDLNLVKALQVEGYTVIINDKGEIPVYLYSINGVIIEKILEP